MLSKTHLDLSIHKQSLVQLIQDKLTTKSARLFMTLLIEGVMLYLIQEVVKELQLLCRLQPQLIHQLSEERNNGIITRDTRVVEICYQKITLMELEPHTSTQTYKFKTLILAQKRSMYSRQSTQHTTLHTLTSKT